MLRFFLVTGAVLVLAVPVQARVWVIHPDGTGDAPTIGAAVDSLESGDVIELTDGVFFGPGNRDLTASDRWYLVRSQSGHPEDCVIDCQGSPTEHHRAFTFAGEG